MFGLLATLKRLLFWRPRRKPTGGQADPAGRDDTGDLPSGAGIFPLQQRMHLAPWLQKSSPFRAGKTLSTPDGQLSRPARAIGLAPWGRGKRYRPLTDNLRVHHERLD